MSNLRSTRDTLTEPEAIAFVNLIEIMAEVHHRTGHGSRGAVPWPHPTTVTAINRWGLEPAEVAEWRALRERGFTSEEAAGVVIRSRRTGDA